MNDVDAAIHAAENSAGLCESCGAIWSNAVYEPTTGHVCCSQCGTVAPSSVYLAAPHFVRDTQEMGWQFRSENFASTHAPVHRGGLQRDKREMQRVRLSKRVGDLAARVGNVSHVIRDQAVQILMPSRGKIVTLRDRDVAAAIFISCRLNKYPIQSLYEFSAAVGIDQMQLQNAYCALRKRRKLIKATHATFDVELSLFQAVARLRPGLQGKERENICRDAEIFIQLMRSAGAYEGRNRFGIIGAAVVAALRRAGDHDITSENAAAVLRVHKSLVCKRLHEIGEVLIRAVESTGQTLRPGVTLFNFAAPANIAEITCDLDLISTVASGLGPILLPEVTPTRTRNLNPPPSINSDSELSSESEDDLEQYISCS